MGQAEGSQESEFSYLENQPLNLCHHFREARKLVTISPESSMTKSRTFADKLLEIIASKRGSPRKLEGKNEESFHDLIVRMSSEGHITNGQRRAFFAIKDPANDATHGDLFSEAVARELIGQIEWLARSFQKDLQPEPAQSTQDFAKGQSSRAKTEETTRNADNAFEFARAANPPPREPRNEEHNASWGGALAAVVIGGIVLIVLLRIWHNSDAPPSNEVAAVNAQTTVGDSQSANTQVQAPVAPTVVPFGQEEYYKLTPKPGVKGVKERSGPGWQYAEVTEFAPGVVIKFTGRAVDGDGVGWLQLGDGSGFIKETLLTLATSADLGETPAAPQTPPDNPSAQPPTDNLPDVSNASSPPAPDDSSPPPATETSPPPAPAMVTYRVCPPAGFALPCELINAPAGSIPAYQFPAQGPAMAANPGAPNGGIGFTFRFGQKRGRH